MPMMKIKDFDIFYEMHGEGKPLLLIHGLGSSSRDWELQISELSKYYRVITIDLHGHGKSSKLTTKYSIHDFAVDCALIIKELKFDSINILGISMGAAVGFDLAISYPDLINSLIAVNMGVKIPVKTFSEKFNHQKVELFIKIFGMKKLGEIFAPTLFPLPEQEELRNYASTRWGENDKKSYIIAKNSLKNWSVEEELHKITCPTLVIAADGDFTSVESKEDYVKKIPNGQITIIINSHHAVPMEKPEEFNRIVLDFLKQI